MDNIFEKAIAFRAAITNYWAKTKAFFANKAVRVGLALAVVAVIAAYAHHRGAEGKADLRVQVELLTKQLADAQSRPTPQPAIPYWQCNGPKDTRHPQCPDSGADELKSKLAESEKAKAKLQKKVSDYEKQLAKHRGKGGSFVLSPSDARSLSNIR